MEAKEITLPEIYKNKKGQAFEYVVFRHQLSPHHNYWLYTIQVKHDVWGYRGFGVYATKEAFPLQELAEQLAKTLAIDAVKERMEEASQDGFPLYFPHTSEGWWLL